MMGGDAHSILCDPETKLNPSPSCCATIAPNGVFLSMRRSGILLRNIVVRGVIAGMSKGRQKKPHCVYY